MVKKFENKMYEVCYLVSHLTSCSNFVWDVYRLRYKWKKGWLS